MENEKRLIDANAVIKDIDNYYHNSVFPHPGTTWLRGLELAVGLLLNAPIVDAVEVVHGRWVEKVDMVESYLSGCTEVFYECSVCASGNIGESPYCPNCGAKMDGGNEDV